MSSILDHPNENFYNYIWRFKIMLQELSCFVIGKHQYSRRTICSQRNVTTTSSILGTSRRSPSIMSWPNRCSLASITSLAKSIKGSGLQRSNTYLIPKGLLPHPNLCLSTGKMMVFFDTRMISQGQESMRNSPSSIVE